MRNPHGRLRALAQLAAVAAVTLALATPASAQFGGLKKKLKGQAAQEGVNKAATAAGAPAAPAEAANAAAPGGGTIVLTDDVVGQLLTGLKAGKAERAAAAKEDTPYGQYLKAQAAYAEWRRDEAARRKALHEAADIMFANTEEIGRILTLEQGKPLADATMEVAGAGVWLKYFADLELPREVIQDDVLQRLLTFPNVLLTGHQAFCTRDALTSIADTTLGSITAFNRGEPLANRVAAERLKPAA